MNEMHGLFEQEGFWEKLQLEQRPKGGRQQIPIGGH